MKEFKANVVEKADKIEIEISGFFDESSKLPSLKTKKDVEIHFKDLSLMNSYGIKIWCRWADEHKALPAITLQECPFLFTKNFSSIKGFLTDNMKVKSLFVPYYNDQSSETKDVLLNAGVDFKEDGSVQLPEVKDSEGHPMEVDVNPDSYFQFLKKK
jgi:hypothetical protein